MQLIRTQLQCVNAGAFAGRAQKVPTHGMQWLPGMYWEFAGDAAAQSAATRQLLAHGALATARVVIRLFRALRRMRTVTLVLLNLPFALVGGVLVALRTGDALPLGVLVGFVILSASGRGLRRALELADGAARCG